MARLGIKVILVNVIFAVLLTTYLGAITTRLQLPQSLSSPSPSPSPSPYRIILDGGSTGSRLYVYEFTYSTLTGITSCHRRLNIKAEIPISSFATSPTTSIAKHLLPLFYRAAKIIPTRYHSTTRVYYQATAGMRLLSPQTQKQVYDNLFDGLTEDEGFAFRNVTKRDQVGTLEGHLEAFYGAMAANYLEGLIDVNLRLTDDGGNDGDIVDGPLGALDMGGASMQIVYLPDSENDDYTDNDSDSSSTNCVGDRNTLCEEEFFSKSYLSYGANEFRKRLWNQWIIDSQRRNLKGNTTNDEDEERNKVLSNPCFYKGYTAEYNGYTLLGTGDAEECTAQIQRLIQHQQAMDYISYTGNTTSTNSTQSKRMVGGIEHPMIKGKFIAMSLFFFALDCLRELSDNDKLSLSWPNPSIEELGNALDGLCSRKWYGDLEEIPENSVTSASALPHRCFESVYIVTLLRDGFGFLPQSRDITFTYMVKDIAIDWSLGMALALFAQENNATATILGEEDFDKDGKEKEKNKTPKGRGLRGESS